MNRGKREERFVNIIIKTTFFGQRAEWRGAVKGIGKFFVALLVLVGVAVPSVWAGNNEMYLYHENGEKCVFARMYRDQYMANEQPLPIGLRKTLVKCDKYEKLATQKRGRDNRSAGWSTEDFSSFTYNNR